MSTRPFITPEIFFKSAQDQNGDHYATITPWDKAKLSLAAVTQLNEISEDTWNRSALSRLASSLHPFLWVKEEAEWQRVVQRFDKVCKKAHDLDVSLLVDAEESWMQDAADALVEDMMRRYNIKKTIVFNTLQTYRWDRLLYLEELHQRAQKEGFKIGVKVVRGAYMEKEIDRAATMGYPSPICATKAETDANFNETVAYILNNLKDISIFAGTHNEESCYLIMERMRKKGLPKNHYGIWFGQLYGMSDHISFNLAAHGYNVAKYLPFGPVRDVMPYLIRRAEENTSVAGQTSRELTLLKKERKRRKI
ncbi:unnamed protein product [Cyprideis torosa]|uniref:Proline dehydrogenase n=1 Tax=Cyprideis torosa TaxID=163714 RepID=A0A7R8ZRE5_9CRUS|nr:unnamed protein product [Cyprideis torosa]CAG0898729.1 unnamed protein product [Cyprideis torosa]